MQKFGDSIQRFGRYIIAIIILSVTAIGAALALSVSMIDSKSKVVGFFGLTAGLFIFCLVLYIYLRAIKKYRYRKSVLSLDSEESEEKKSAILKPLAELDEACEFFVGLLRVSDSFRLISYRLKDILPFQAIVLYLLNETRTQLLPTHANGVEIDVVDKVLAEQSFNSGRVEIDSYLGMDSSQLFASSVAIPLRNGSNVFAVLQLYFGTNFDAGSVDNYLFETVGKRIAPFFLSSLAQDRTKAKALTDTTTDLPNERAFYLALEKEIAESNNVGIDSPLSVLAIDIRDFEAINLKYGYPVGDQALKFVGQVIRENLRQNDFISRSVNDEFLVILPRASKEITRAITDRIRRAFNERKFETSDGEELSIELNIGWATYSNEGKTPGELLNFAELKKEQQKLPVGANVVAFPREFVG